MFAIRTIFFRLLKKQLAGFSSEVSDMIALIERKFVIWILVLSNLQIINCFLNA